MKVWLDDERPMPDFFDTHVKTADEAIELIKTGNVEVISLDHDLAAVGVDAKTGYDVAKFIEQYAYEGGERMTIMVHTQNPVGRKNICMACQNAYKFWDAKNKV